tara:strand:- start:8503 stop:8751 length:249 start_codon:yes stop_codon:yes gene_type:complete
MKKDNILGFIYAIIIILAMIGLVSYIVYGLHLSVKASNLCQEECENSDALTHRLRPNGKFNMDDICTCFYENSTKTFLLEEK